MKPSDSIQWHNWESNKVLNYFGVPFNRGRTQNEIKDLQIKYGRNEMPDSNKQSWYNIIAHQFFNPLIYLLIIAAGLALVLGAQKDALVILIVVTFNALVGAIQEGRAERSLVSLRKMTKIKARVLRDGKEQLIEASELVPGDIFTVSAGESVPVDARLIKATALACTEATLTGESVPVSKNESVVVGATAITDRRNMIFAGTFITSGRGVAIAIATGKLTELGQIVNLANLTDQPKTQLEIRIHDLGKYISYFSFAVFTFVIGLGLYRGISFSQIFMIAVSQVVSIVPEGLPISFTVALAVGVQRMAKRNTIVRRLSAIESLGSTTVICSDKTGTLTKNEMTVVQFYLFRKSYFFDVSGVGYSPGGECVERKNKKVCSIEEISSDSEFDIFLKVLICCNDAQLHNQIMGDPTEIALLFLAKKCGKNIEQVRADCPRLAELPFDSDLKMMATAHKIGERSFVFVKGAPEALLKLSQPLEDHKKIQDVVQEMAALSLRVLSVGIVPDAHIDSEKGFAEFKNRLSILGVVGEFDPPREEVAESVQLCIRAGIKPVMVTGDHKMTGFAVARTLGIALPGDRVLDGPELDALSEQEFDALVDTVSVFARVHPAQKLRIVKALQKKGHIVAMTGDGVNDTPALIQANVGVAMGITGTEVAKESSKIIIADDNFSTIVAAINEGRTVYQNLKKLILFLFVTSVDEVVILLIVLIFGYSPPLAAVQILWINLVSEGALTVSLIMEPPEGDEMKRKPISPDEPLFDRKLLMRMPLMVGASVLSTFGWFYYQTKLGVPTEIVQTETFTVLVVSQWFNALNCRSAVKSALTLDLFNNIWLVVGLIFANILHFLVIYWTPLAQFFHTVPLTQEQFLLTVIIGSLVLWVEECRKFVARMI